jgi:hypothetical protein
MVSDEGAALMRLTPSPDGFTHSHTWSLPDGIPLHDTEPSKPELDLEALCAHSSGLIAVGSHGQKRKKLKDSKSYTKNLERLYANLDPEPARRAVLPLTVDARGLTVGTPINVYDALVAHPVLGPFAKLASKENGIDIEGAACTSDTLWLGFRGPVLRGNLVPVARMGVPSGALQDVRYVNLNGHGIRDMAPVKDGFLLLTGPTGDGPAVGSIVWWDGTDCMPSDDRPACRTRVLDQWSAGDGRKAEGLVIESEDPLQVLLLWDGAVEGVRKRL